MHLIIYARIIDGKKKGLTLDGPFLGPECPTLHEAHQAAKDVISESKDHTLIRIYSMKEHTYDSAKKTAETVFGGIFENMVKAAGIVERPSTRSRRKKKKKAAKKAKAAAAKAKDPQ